jgi:type IV pilus assembly protein PilN
MIKINLLPQKKKAREAQPGERDVVLGMVAIAGVFAAVYFGYHRAQQKKLKDLMATNGELSADNEGKRDQVAKQKDIEQVVTAEQEREAAIAKLVKAKSVPAHLLQEMGDMLTPGRMPTMTKEMSDRTSDGPKGDPNRRFAVDWDPKHVWITSFAEKDGAFALQGGAQSDGDVTQLAKRMQASVYFQNVTPTGAERTTDQVGNITYYTFTITGKVVY